MRRLFGIFCEQVNTGNEFSRPADRLAMVEARLPTRVRFTAVLLPRHRVGAQCAEMDPRNIFIVTEVVHFRCRREAGARRP